MAEAVTKTQTVRAQVRLRERILAGELPGGSRLLEVSLAAELNTSRTPVRDALARLAEEGLLERARRGGFVVRSFGLDDVVDAIELRGVLEGTAARLAAERGADARALAAAQAAVGALDRAFASGMAPSLDDYSRFNARFHEALWAAPGSAMLRQQIERVSRLPFASPQAFLHGREADAAFGRSLVAGQEQHRAILEAIAAREGARAEALAREHARIARRNLSDALDRGRDAIRAIPGLALVAE